MTAIMPHASGTIISREVLARIDAHIDAAERLASNDVDLRAMLSKIPGELSNALAYLPSVGDPFSSAYIGEVSRIHREVIGRTYTVSTEGLPGLNPAWEEHWAFPYGTQAHSIVGGFLIAYGYIIKVLALPKGARILEVGCGLGSFTFLLAKMGYRVDALDVSDAQCSIVRKVVETLPIKPNVICQALDEYLHGCLERYDAVIFFESFHHFMDHFSLLHTLVKAHLTPRGKIALAGEPILRESNGMLPYPWGIRLDGESLRAMRKWGWLELGFTEAYIRNMFARIGLSFVRHQLEISPWADVVVGVPE
jgi:2-polyprenyl-3-methyl-5-hydroxy-6-metoxy-1,4-benzoquinol methylase